MKAWSFQSKISSSCTPGASQKQRHGPQSLRTFGDDPERKELESMESLRYELCFGDYQISLENENLDHCMKPQPLEQVLWATCLPCIYIYIHAYIHAYIHTYIHTYIRTYVHTYIHTFLPTYIRTYIHTHTYIYMYIHTCVDCCMVDCVWYNSNTCTSTSTRINDFFGAMSLRKTTLDYGRISSGDKVPELKKIV